VTTDLYWDPFAAELRDDPYPLWARLRDEAPVWHNDRYDFWVLSRFLDVEHAHADNDSFSSSHGVTVEMMSADPIDTGMIILLDPPKHTVLRKLVSRAFTIRRMSMIEDQVREICARLLDPHRDSSGFDYVQDFSAILPPTVISSLLGIPASDQERLRLLVDEMFHIDDSDVGMRNETSRNASAAIRAYLHEQFEERRTRPRQDVMTDLVQAEVMDDHTGMQRHLTADELVDFGLGIFSAGTETVARLLGWVADLLDAHPEQRANIVADRGMIPNAVEETLRFQPPSPVQGRFTHRSVTLHGVTIPANVPVVLLTGSAGRDERKYEQPDSFDISRKIDHHVSFGYGIHFCLGAALARLETRIAIEETVKRWPEWSVDRSSAELLYTSTVRGYARLPIQL
jgi:cytochrome P450